MSNDSYCWTSNRAIPSPSERILFLLAQFAHLHGRPDSSLTPDEYNAVREAQLCRTDFNRLVVFEDARFIVIDKPFDLRIDAGRDSACVWSTLADALRVFRLASDVPVPPKFCHQLDYSTSGIIAIAKTRAAAALAQHEFAARRTVKRYSALLFGRLLGDVTVDAPIADDVDGATHRMHAFRRADPRPRPPSTRSARTLVVVLAHGRWHGRDATRVRFEPESGRRHQLRLHAALIGHPIVGDTTYAADTHSFRMMLHSQYLHFPFADCPPLTLETADPFVGLLADEVEFTAAAAAATAAAASMPTD
jgi:tRNA pseudouridine32 synthase/23S rRNA pseudouridine746 synthase